MEISIIARTGQLSQSQHECRYVLSPSPCTLRLKLEAFCSVLRSGSFWLVGLFFFLFLEPAGCATYKHCPASWLLHLNDWCRWGQVHAQLPELEVRKGREGGRPAPVSHDHEELQSILKELKVRQVRGGLGGR